MHLFRALICVALFAPAALHADRLTVFAAASLKGPLEDIAGPDAEISFSYAGSGTLARQVQNGAPADVVILANADWMQVLADADAVISPSIVNIVGNRLVLIGQQDMDPIVLTADAITAALGDGRLAMGFVDSVPAGIYGKAALEYLGLWADLNAQVAQVDNVRAALALVARGEAPLGIVYQSDAALLPALSVLAHFPAQSHPPIGYFAAITAQSKHPDAAAFLQSLQAPAAMEVFAAAGFCPNAEAC